MFEWFVSVTLLFLAALPALMVLANLREFRKALHAPTETIVDQVPQVSVLVPARNEESAIWNSLTTILNQSYQNLEVIVLDDHSEDRTAQIVSDLSETDSRLKLVQSNPLPSGWNGKQFACWQLAQQSHGEYLLFLDADVRLRTDAIAKIVATQQSLRVDLLSGFPKQETGTFAEKLLIPLMYLVLLGYLPLRRSRLTNQASMAAGCGQLFYANRSKYFSVGGHQAISSSRHDGLMLPRAFREYGATTDLIDASDIATCRMYQNMAQVQRGLLKNAIEGIASWRLILPFSVLLLGGFVLPLAMLLHALFWQWQTVTVLILVAATTLSVMPRILIALRFEESIIGALLNPIALIWFVGLQWFARLQNSFGIQMQWRGRSS